MKNILFCLLCLLSFMGKGQQDTLEVSRWQLSDSIYGNLGTHIGTGFLFNRTLLDSTASFAYNTHKKSEYTSNADLHYRLMNELKMMAMDTSHIPDLYSMYIDASTYTADFEFDQDRVVCPIGITDFEFDYLDLSFAQSSGLISVNGLTLQDSDPQDNSAYSKRQCALIAPLSDYFHSPDISIVFREQDFKSNYRTFSEVQSIEVAQNGNWNTIVFDEEYQLSLGQDAVQYFYVRVTYTDERFIEDSIFINTPEFFASEPIPRGSFKCDYEGDKVINSAEHGNTKLKYCLIRGCNNTTNQPKKPYVFVTGYRPPIFEQFFSKSWELYNENHGYYLSTLVANNYDIYIVKFNIHANPQGHGMQESAELLVDFLEEINSNKYDDYNETVIQGSSMGADIVRLALMKMEKEHWTNQNYPHHHTRLFISHDANYYGANIPLGYQYQIFSGFYHQPAAINPFPGESMYLRLYLFATIQQKAVKELLAYHVKGNDFPFLLPVKTKDFQPSPHARRNEFISALNAVDNHKYFVHLPSSTRNIATSLGKISETNTVNSQNLNFLDRGQLWKDLSFPGKLQIRTAEFNASSYKNLYHREELMSPAFLFPIFYTLKHKANVRNMQEIDNASGSYLNDFANIILMTDYAYNNMGYPLFINYVHNAVNQQLFTHKPVVSALAINKNLWPANGSMTMNIHDLDLMFDELNFNPNLPSNHYGYPNLGRPNDHFLVTPFEGIAVDHQIDPHIKLEDALPDNINKLNEFLHNEVEPWFLGLQNQVLGSQARSNYVYRSRRRAKYLISVGHLVTPKTDPGDYVVNENARLRLEAGEAIDLHPGTTFKAGCEATLIIHYEECRNRNAQGNSEGIHTSEANNDLAIASSSTPKQQFIESSELRVFPNPSEGSFTLVNLQDVPIAHLAVYDFSGNLVLEQRDMNVARYVCEACLDKGVYVLQVTMDTVVKQIKLVVP